MARFLALLATLALSVETTRADENTAGLEFFERQVRPLLAEHCYQCHGKEKQKASLRLDSPAAIRKGGDRGAAIVSGDPDKSLLIQAIRYTEQELRMPPRSKLSDGQIADLVQWVKLGAPMPADSAVAQQDEGFDLDSRRKHWAYQPVRSAAPPPVKDGGWCRTPVDTFILARLEAAGLSPAPPADRRSLLRRVSFDLLGLPPSADDIAKSLADEAPGAYERLIDRLLASPHYGERWGRHWLDLVRYAETLGHEFDFDIHNAWRYRDYVVRAFNQDVPYDQFIREHLAGDLLVQPRRDPRTGLNESVLGTAWFWMGEEKHSPVDSRQQEADRIDNQIDVFGKAFLGQTLACARCHDHKFDAISAQDYYSLAGVLKSSRYQQAFLDPPERFQPSLKRLQAIKAELRSLLADETESDLATLPLYVQAARKHLLAPKESPIAAVAQEARLEAGLLNRWVEALQVKHRPPDHPLHLLSALCDPKNGPFDRAWANLRQRLAESDVAARQLDPSTTRVVDFSTAPGEDWFVHGQAFGNQPTRAGDFHVLAQPAGVSLRSLPGGMMHSGRIAPQLEGVLQSPTLVLEKRYLLFRVAGRQGRINVVVDGLTIIRDPIYGPLTMEVNDDQMHWRVMDVGMWHGCRAYIEFADSTTPGPSQPLGSLASAGKTGESWIAVSDVLLTDRPSPPTPRPDPCASQLVSQQGVESFEELAGKLGTELAAAVKAWRSDSASDATHPATGLFGALIEAGVLGKGSSTSARPLLEEYQKLVLALPAPVRGPAISDGTGEDERVFIRGSYKALGGVAPRRLPLAVGGDGQRLPVRGSGRLELAERLTDASNPLLARVMVNRLWHHHFGAGLVRSTDDFGRMGEMPTHPELLDYLANELMTNGWSLKHLHRLMVSSSTYQMSSRSRAGQEERDPENRLCHRMAVRRLEAEAIRDSILAVSGRLQRGMEGPSVPPYLTPYMEGRGRPGASGPLDGQGRRSIYLNVRRNFLNPLFLAYDYPIPFSTMGRRTVSNVPAQALTLLNDPFAVDQARLWARRELATRASNPAERVARIYLTALSRPPTEAELAAALAFLAEQSRDRQAHSAGEPAWADLCHVLLNTKEFIFLE